MRRTPGDRRLFLARSTLMRMRSTFSVSGLSGVVDRIPNPGFDSKQKEGDGNPRFFVLRRTLAIRYELPGDMTSRMAAQPIRRNREWVMR